MKTLEEGILGNLSFEDLESAYEDGDREEIKPRQPDNTNKELTEIKQESIGSKSTGIERKNNTFLQYEEYYDRIKEEHILERVIDQYKTYEDKEAALSAIRPLIAIIKGNEYVLISVLADLKRRNVYKELGFKSHTEAISTLFSHRHSTCVAYTNIGLTFFNVEGKPIADYVMKLSVGHLNSLMGTIKGNYYVYGNKVGHEFIDAIIKASEVLLESTLAGDEDAVAKALDVSHIHVTSNRSYNNEEALQSAIYLSYLSALNKYTVVKEMTTGRGFADVVFIPHLQNVPALIIELKHGNSAESALGQIRNKKYFDSLLHYEGNLLFVCISYDENKKTHMCKIERFIK